MPRLGPSDVGRRHKPRYSASYGTPLEFLLDELGVSHLILARLTVDICVALQEFAPAGMLLSENLQVLQLRGDVGELVIPVAGQAVLNARDLVREGLFPALHSAVHQARAQDSTARRQGVRVKTASGVIR